MAIQKNEGMIKQERAEALIRMDRNRFSCGTKKKTLYNVDDIDFKCTVQYYHKITEQGSNTS